MGHLTIKINRFLFILLWGVMALAGCYYDNEESLYSTANLCDTSYVSYQADVLPVFKSNCVPCHGNSTYLTSGGGVNLEGYANLTKFINSDKGRLLGSIKQNGNYSSMPKGGTKLDDCTILKIESWINNNMPNN